MSLRKRILLAKSMHNTSSWSNVKGMMSHIISDGRSLELEWSEEQCVHQNGAGPCIGIPRFQFLFMLCYPLNGYLFFLFLHFIFLMCLKRMLGSLLFARPFHQMKGISLALCIVSCSQNYICSAFISWGILLVHSLLISSMLHIGNITVLDLIRLLPSGNVGRFHKQVHIPPHGNYENRDMITFVGPVLWCGSLSLWLQC